MVSIEDDPRHVGLRIASTLGRRAPWASVGQGHRAPEPCCRRFPVGLPARSYLLRHHFAGVGGFTPHSLDSAVGLFKL